MANSPVDKSEDFVQSGMTLITEVNSDRLLKSVKKAKAKEIPADRLSRPCGGAGGFDDYVEWLIL